MKNRISCARLSAVAVAVSGLAVSQFAAAQSQLKEVVVTASLVEQRVQDALPSSTLITREQIERSQTSDLPTLLKQVAGVEIAQTGGRGTLASAFIRGGSSSHTLVLIDGVAVKNLNFGTAALEHLPLSNVDRIEVVRGTVSSLYGSSALGGVIQIFTRDGANAKYANVDVQVGPDGFQQVQAGGSVKLGNGTRLSANVEEVTDKGFNATNQTQIVGTNPDRDPYKRRAYSLGLAQDFKDGRVSLTTRESKGTTSFDSEFGPSTAIDTSRFAERGVTLQVEYKLTPDLTIDAAVTRSRDNLDAATVDPADHNNDYSYYVYSLSKASKVGLKWNVAKGQTITAGFENNVSHIESDTPYAKTEQTQRSTRLGYQADFEAHQIQLNVRQDRYNDFGTANTYYMGYGYRVTPEWRVNVSKATGFKAPTFNDLYYPYGGGNPNLKPEHVDTKELGVQYTVGKHMLRVTYFDSQYIDLINGYPPVNINKASNKGTEMVYTGQYGSTQVQAGLTLQDPKDASNGTQLARRAKQMANMGVTHTLGAWTLGGDVKYSGERFSKANNSTPLGSYTLLNLSARYAISKELSAYGRVENVTDRVYQTVYGYNQPARGVYVGLNWQPKL